MTSLPTAYPVLLPVGHSLCLSDLFSSFLFSGKPKRILSALCCFRWNGFSCPF